MRLIFKTSSVTPDFLYIFNIILSFSTYSQSLKKICAREILGANVLNLARSSLVSSAAVFWDLAQSQKTAAKETSSSHRQLQRQAGAT